MKKPSLNFEKLLESYSSLMDATTEIPKIGDTIRTKKMQMEGKVIRIGENRAGYEEVFFKIADGRTMKTPLANVTVIEQLADENLQEKEKSGGFDDFLMWTWYADLVNKRMFGGKSKIEQHSDRVTYGTPKTNNIWAHWDKGAGRGTINDQAEEGPSEFHRERKARELEPTLEEKLAKILSEKDPCWKNYKQVGMKVKGGKKVPNCVPISEHEYTLEGDEFVCELSEDEDLLEADYQGRSVTLNKPMQGDVKKFKVYVKDPSTGNVKKVNFGDPDMKIRKSNPAARKSFRARHNCDNPGPKTKARYWSCRKW